MVFQIVIGGFLITNYWEHADQGGTNHYVADEAEWQSDVIDHYDISGSVRVYCGFAHYMARFDEDTWDNMACDGGDSDLTDCDPSLFARDYDDGNTQPYDWPLDSSGNEWVYNRNENWDGGNPTYQHVLDTYLAVKAQAGEDPDRVQLLFDNGPNLPDGGEADVEKVCQYICEDVPGVSVVLVHVNAGRYIRTSALGELIYDAEQNNLCEAPDSTFEPFERTREEIVCADACENCVGTPTQFEVIIDNISSLESCDNCLDCEDCVNLNGTYLLDGTAGTCIWNVTSSTLCVYFGAWTLTMSQVAGDYIIRVSNEAGGGNDVVWSKNLGTTIPNCQGFTDLQLDWQGADAGVSGTCDWNGPPSCHVTAL